MAQYSISPKTKRQNIVLPEKLHATLKEVSFREDMNMTELICRSLESFFEDEGNITSVKDATEEEEKETHTCVNLPIILIKRLKYVAHYQHVHLKVILIQALKDYLDELSSKYPNIYHMSNN